LKAQPDDAGVVNGGDLSKPLIDSWLQSMLAIFCLRLAFGLVACLLLLSRAQVNPRFFRTHFLTALGLTTFAAVLLREEIGQAEDAWLLWTLVASCILTFLGSVVWHIEGNPGGFGLIVLAIPFLGAALALASAEIRDSLDWGWRIADDISSAALLGAATTAMLLGHSYLIAPTMSITPLVRLLAALFVATGLRALVSITALWSWTGPPSGEPLELETILWLVVRWAVGFLASAALGWMAWETAKIRSTQSATGILYVVVIFCFLGELTAQLLSEQTGFPL